MSIGVATQFPHNNDNINLPVPKYSANRQTEIINCIVHRLLGLMAQNPQVKDSHMQRQISDHLFYNISSGAHNN